MEFLVRIEVRLPEGFDDAKRAALVAAESERGRELIAAGTVRRVWRLPGRWANVSLYDVHDANALHDALTSLPLWPWMHVTVEALARHPLDDSG